MGGGKNAQIYSPLITALEVESSSETHFECMEYIYIYLRILIIYVSNIFLQSSLILLFYKEIVTDVLKPREKTPVIGKLIIKANKTDIHVVVVLKTAFERSYP